MLVPGGVFVCKVFQGEDESGEALKKLEDKVAEQQRERRDNKPFSTRDRVLEQKIKPKQERIDAVDAHLCKGCVLGAPKVQTTKGGPPRPYEFNDTVGAMCSSGMIIQRAGGRKQGISKDTGAYEEES